jgi:hypothetical protein
MKNKPAHLKRRRAEADNQLTQNKTPPVSAQYPPTAPADDLAGVPDFLRREAADAGPDAEPGGTGRAKD